jgi:type I restriction enzyme S subunit
MEKVSTKTAVPYMNKENCNSIPIFHPSIFEQTKIANFLTAIDDRITQLTQKVDGLEQYKKAVMQQIFSQKLRFKDEKGRALGAWDSVLLGELCKITTGKSNREDSSLIGEYTFFDRSQDIRTSDIFLFDCEAVIVAGEGQDFIPKHFIGKFDLHQRTYAIIGFNGNYGRYIFYYITYFRKYFLSQAVGSTVKSLRLPMFEKMPIKLPCRAEQEKIAGFLGAVDEKLAQAKAKLDAVKQYKQGLLQQMFV